MIKKHLQSAFECFCLFVCLLFFRFFGGKATLKYNGVATMTDVFQFGFPETAFEWFFQADNL